MQTAAVRPGPRHYRETVLADAPVGYWRLDDVASGVAHDQSPTGLHLPYAAGWTQEPGLLAGDNNQALTWAGGAGGASALFVPTANPGVDFSAGVTVEFWVAEGATEWTTYAAEPLRKGTAGRADCMVTVYCFGTYGGLYPNNRRLIELLANPGGVWTGLVAVALPDDGRHHVVAAYDSTSGAYIAIDGVVTAVVGPSGPLGLATVAMPGDLVSGTYSVNIPAPAQAIAVTPGTTIHISGYIDATDCTGAGPALIAWDQTTTNQVYIVQAAGSAGYIASAFVVPAGVTSLRLAFDSGATTVRPGGRIVFGDPHLDRPGDNGANQISDPTFANPSSTGWNFSSGWIVTPHDTTTGQLSGTMETTGVLDELALYNRRLTPAQAQAHYMAGR